MNFTKAREEAFGYNSQHNSIRILTDAERIEEGIQSAAEVWEVKIDVPLPGDKQTEVAFYFILDADFPLSFPKAQLSKKDYEQTKFLPHVDTERTICYIDTVLAMPDFTKPAETVRTCIDEVREVLRKGLFKENLPDFETEFVAYWEGVYLPEEKLLSEVYSVIGEEIGEKGLGVLWYNTEKGEFRSFIHAFNKKYEALKDYLLSKGIPIQEFNAFYLGNQKLETPPYNLTNKGLVAVIKSLGSDYLKNFTHYINRGADVKYVIFDRTINGKKKYLGYVIVIDATKRNRRGFRPNTIDNFKIISNFDASHHVKRISPQDMSKDRLAFRSQGESKQIDQFSVLVAGLGSVGSNLVHFLNAMPVKEYMFVDMDILYLENTGRHLLGYSHTGKPKAIAIRDYIYDKQPLQKVAYRTESIVKTVSNETELVNEFDYIFVAIGRYNHEKWLSDQQSAGVIKKPIFYIWVEPYLAGGHLLYIPPGNNVFDSFFDADAFYKNSVISKECYHTNDKLKLKEAGCQSTFTPYSVENLVGFLAAVYPRIQEAMKKNETQPWALTWIGNKEAIIEMGVDISDFGAKHGSYSIVIV